MSQQGGRDMTNDASDGAFVAPRATQGAATRIADIISAHTPSGTEGASLVNCWCGTERFDTFAHHAEHVAAAIVESLGLTEETAACTCLCEGVGYWPHNHGQIGCTGNPERYHRLVTRWEKA